MHPSGSRLFGFLIPPVRRSRSREIPINLEHLPCSFEPDPLSGKPDPENLRYQAVSKRNNDRLHGLTSASVAHGVGNKDVEKGSRRWNRGPIRLHGWTSAYSGSPSQLRFS